ncbi:hypothetical protein BD770DRAFT_384534 [Pilaira anomala]|nr:hypothetical protein BD770DRAFT_384534 [Pilaira anomala]
MNFSQSPFQPHELNMSPQQFSYGFTGSPYERSESVITCTTNSTNPGKQVQSKAERRAEHNAIERARRESLNVKFQQLAFILPNLQSDSRPSKSTIIDRTLDYVKGSIVREERNEYRIRELEKFTRYLLSEVDKKSTAAAASAASTPIATPVPTPTTSSDEPVLRSPVDIPFHMANISSPPALSSSPPPPPPQRKVQKSIRKSPPSFKRDASRRPVSRLSASMVPKLDSTTNWPIQPQQQHTLQSQQQLIDQQQQQQQQQQQMMKENQSLNFQHSQYQQLFQKFPDPTIPDTFLMNDTYNYMPPPTTTTTTTTFMNSHQHRR